MRGAMLGILMVAILSLAISNLSGISNDGLCIIAVLWIMFCIAYPKLDGIYDVLEDIKHIIENKKSP